MKNVQAVIDMLGLDVKPSNGEWSVGLCPFHDDRSPSFTINTNTGYWKCFAGCGSGSLMELAARLMDTNVFSLADVMAVLDGEPKTRPVTNDQLTAMLDRVRGTADEVLPESVLHKYLPYCDYLSRRGISRETAVKFGLRYDVSGQQVVIPIRDHAGRLRGMEGRTVIPGLEPRYLPIHRCKKSTWVYGEHLYPVGTPRVVLEGALGAARADTLGLKYVVAALTSSLSGTQRDRLAQAPLVVILYDPDSAGDIGGDIAVRSLASATNVVKRVLMSDIDEIRRTELENVIDNSGLFRKTETSVE